jgi:hypothetical protein
MVSDSTTDTKNGFPAVTINVFLVVSFLPSWFATKVRICVTHWDQIAKSYLILNTERNVKAGY